MLAIANVHIRTLALPRVLLLPGIAAFVASLTAYLLAKHMVGSDPPPYDFTVYLMGGDAWLNGRPVYEQVMHDELGAGYFTYPPITLLLFAPLTLLPFGVAYAAALIVNFAALWGVVWLSLRSVGCHGTAGTIGAAFALTGLALWLQPVHDTLDQGQVNLLLMLLVVAGFSLGGRTAGVLVGIAAAIKLTPAIFIVYLLLIRRFRDAATASVIFVIVSGLAFMTAPRDSWQYWFKGTFSDARRVVSPLTVGAVSNQSINGILHRFLGAGSGTLWLAIALVVAVCGMSLGAAIHRRVSPFAGVLAIALTGLLISPVSWHEHWVWVVPIAIWVLGASYGIHARHPFIAGALPVVLIFPFLTWPFAWTLVPKPANLSLSLLGPVRHMWDKGVHNPAVAILSTTYVAMGLALLVGGWWLVRFGTGRDVTLAERNHKSRAPEADSARSSHG
jgi:alpha-1,2-mannosyltransferase